MVFSFPFFVVVEGGPSEPLLTSACRQAEVWRKPLARFLRDSCRILASAGERAIGELEHVNALNRMYHVIAEEPTFACCPTDTGIDARHR